MNRTTLRVAPAAIFVFLMQLLYAASSSEISQSEGYGYIRVAGYLIAGLMAVLVCLKSSITLLQIIKICFIGLLMGLTALNSAGREFVLLALYWIVLKDADQSQLIVSFEYAAITALFCNTILALLPLLTFKIANQKNCMVWL